MVPSTMDHRIGLVRGQGAVALPGHTQATAGHCSATNLPVIQTHATEETTTCRPTVFLNKGFEILPGIIYIIMASLIALMRKHACCLQEELVSIAYSCMLVMCRCSPSAGILLGTHQRGFLFSSWRERRLYMPLYSFAITEEENGIRFVLGSSHNV
jgi:hypothetical protein